MKLTVFILPALLTIGSNAVAQAQKAVIVTYQADTPESVVEKAMNAIKDAGGYITHEYTLFKGFAANAPAAILEQVQIWGNDYKAVIEEDRVVNVDTGSASQE